MMNLPKALDAERADIPSQAGSIGYYRSRAKNAAEPPLLLVHSINAAGSAYEMKPIFDRFRDRRSVYALDLPGFGFSDRSDREYSPRMMTDAVHAIAELVRKEENAETIDVAALSLGCEYAARAAAERPGHFRTLCLISPTGTDSRAPYYGPPGSNRGKAVLYALFRNPLWSRGFFTMLTSRVSIRYFLKKTYGRDEINEDLLEYDYMTTHQPGARHAPYRFVSGYLFSNDITRIYDALALPVLVVHGVRGDFVDYKGLEKFRSKPGWRIEVMQTGALPHFEMPGEFLRYYDAFLATQGG
jgi:pimeloyl-ACP methyl ester carboxylesterase